MDIVVSIINNLIDGKLDYKKVINNKEKVIEYLNEYRLIKIDLRDIDIFANKILTDCLLASLLDYKDAFPISLLPYKITSERKVDYCFGDLLTEIFPIFVYLLFNGDFDSIEKVLLNKSKLLQKGSLFDVYAKLCIENNNVDRLQKFINKNIDKNLYEGFKDDVLSVFSIIDMPKAFEHLAICEDEYSIDYRSFGYPFEVRNMFLHKISLEDQTQYTVDELLFKLNQCFSYKVVNYDFAPYENKFDDEDLYYLKEEKVEKELEKIIKKNLNKDFNNFLKDVQKNNLIMSFFYKSPEIMESLAHLEQLLAIKRTIEIHLSYKFLNTENEDFFMYLCCEFSTYIESYYEELELSNDEEAEFDKQNNHLFKSKDFHDVESEYDD